MEIWDLYDRERNVIGEHVRGRELPEGGYHLVVHVWVRNSEGNYLMCRRSRKKATCPLMWECVGGSAFRGEDSLSAALRETHEETGLKFRREDGELLFTLIRDTVSGKRINDIVDVWRFRHDGDIPLEQATTDEVEEARWMSRDEIAALREQGRLVTSIKDLGYFFESMD
ncbi:MAG: NUDIX domain-containing protein [Eubacteriales bacterium]|nr:NUDIX domain-containing protein [Eubacteriales bacterium]